MERPNSAQTYRLMLIFGYVSTGAKQSIANVCLSLLNPGDEVLLPTPYWVSYADIINLSEDVRLKTRNLCVKIKWYEANNKIIIINILY